MASSTEIRELRQADGEFSFVVAGPLGEQRIRFWGDVPASPLLRVEPALAVALLPAMAAGGRHPSRVR